MENKLLELRLKNGFTQKEMAAKLNTTLTFYSKIEMGIRNPSFNFIQKVKTTFPNENMDEIFFARFTHVSWV